MPLILSPPPSLLHDSLSFRSLQTFRALPSQSFLVAAASEPCVKVAGVQFADPADPIACYKSFPLNETLRQNVLAVVSRVFDFYITSI